jgi:hypothetical protein
VSFFSFSRFGFGSHLTSAQTSAVPFRRLTCNAGGEIMRRAPFHASVSGRYGNAIQTRRARTAQRRGRAVLALPLPIGSSTTWLLSHNNRKASATDFKGCADAGAPAWRRNEGFQQSIRPLTDACSDSAARSQPHRIPQPGARSLCDDSASRRLVEHWETLAAPWY